MLQGTYPAHWAQKNAIVNDENKFKVYRVTPETEKSIIDITNNPTPHLTYKHKRESFQPSYLKQRVSTFKYKNACRQ